MNPEDAGLFTQCLLTVLMTSLPPNVFGLCRWIISIESFPLNDPSFQTEQYNFTQAVRADYANLQRSPVIASQQSSYAECAGLHTVTSLFNIRGIWWPDFVKYKALFELWVRWCNQMNCIIPSEIFPPHTFPSPKQLVFISVVPS